MTFLHCTVVVEYSNYQALKSTRYERVPVPCGTRYHSIYRTSPTVRTTAITGKETVEEMKKLRSTEQTLHDVADDVFVLGDIFSF